jgi:hypothetical protein
MKRIAVYLASAALGAGLVGSGPTGAKADMSGMGGGSRKVARNQTVDREDRHDGWQWRHRRDWGWSPGLAWRGYPYNPDNYAYNYGYPDNYAYYGYPSNYGHGYAYDYANPFAIVTAPIAAVTAPVTALTTPAGEAAAAPFVASTSATAALVTGRSVATGQMGKMCSTPVKACELYHASYIGNGCSCRVTGGRSRGTVSP